MGESLRIGSQLFINKDDTEEAVRAWVRSMQEHGLTVIRLFMIWEQVEPRAGEWQFGSYDACLDEASICGLKVVPTLMSVSPPGWMKLTDGPQSVSDLDDPAYQTKARGYVEKIAQRYGNHPALDSWILWNEPTRYITKSKFAMEAYARYIRENFDTIEAYNQISYTQYESFEALAADDDEGSQLNAQPFQSFAERLSWSRFSVYNMNQQLAWIRDVIRENGSSHEVHINPHNLGAEMQGGGQSIWQQSEVVDFLGCSAHPMWHSLRFPEKRWGQSVAFFADLMKSATRHPDGKFWVTELQGGLTLYSAGQAYTPSKEVIREWIWEGLGSGAKAVVFWCFNARNSGYEAGEWALLNPWGGSSPRLEAVKEAAGVIAEHQPLFDLSRSEAAHVMVLYSEASWALGAVEGTGHDPGNPRNVNMYADALAGAYLMFSDLSAEVIFINEDRLVHEGIPEAIQVFVLPNTIVLGLAEIEVLRAYVSRGGLLIADGLIGMKDRNGKLDPATMLEASQLLGAQFKDIVTDGESFSITGLHGSEWPGWFYRLPLEPLGSAEVWGRFTDGSAAMVKEECGSGGQVIRIGTNFFQHYFAKPDVRLLSLLQEHAGKRIDGTVRLANSHADLRMRTLEHPEGVILIIMNKGLETTANLSFAVAGQLKSLTKTGEASVLRVQASETLPWQIAQEDVTVLFFQQQGPRR
ncbi:beta-galactosidase [Paenibacillus sp. HWE-109]|uniref:beta-galactosidase n=1 Tax=Paenibacillus sp. HWE-109 TaxID=1306526 RepID=UPI001EDC9DE8|nr:beta-galactosidase [Paenibacillus sp. HWE-109]UKS28726.1 beta-galactosidase [Paenibacillus sp. HWE-109]